MGNTTPHKTKNDMTKDTLIIEAKKEGYTPSQVRRTMTVGELIGYLEQFDENTPVYLSHDSGYTYGGITQHDFRDGEIEVEDEEPEEAPEPEPATKHSILVTDQTFEVGEDGYPKETGCNVLFEETVDNRPAGSFYSWLEKVWPQFEWELDDGEDWRDNPDSDYCQYVAYIENSNKKTHYILATYDSAHNEEK